MIQAILGTRSNVVGQGTAVGEPLGARQVAVMILGVVPICCRNPCQKAVFGQGSSSWSGELTGARGGSRPWPDVLQFRVGSGHREQMTVSGWMTILQTKEEEVRRSEITWPRPVLEVVPRHELTRNPGLTLKL